ncbi:hypothetical protein ACFE04_024499 [Oxalis oulophora]
MKQKVVVRLIYMNTDEKKSKAKKIAARLPGVSIIEVDGDKLTVTGENIDSVELTSKLRKKLKDAILLSVTEVKPPVKKPAEPSKCICVRYGPYCYCYLCPK